MTLLTIVQSVSEEIGLGTPGNVASSQDPQVKQLRRLLNRAGKGLADRFPWQALTLEGTFTTVATALQVALSSIDANIGWIVNDTIFNRTQRRAVYGPLSLTQYQVQQAMVQTGPFNQYIIQGGSIYFNPVPTAGDSCYFQYVTRAWVSGGKTEYTSDTDEALLDEGLLESELLWRWKRAKGLPWQSDYEESENSIITAAGRDGVKPILDAGGNQFPTSPYLVVPMGDWPVVVV